MEPGLGLSIPIVPLPRLGGAGEPGQELAARVHHCRQCGQVLSRTGVQVYR